MTQPEIRVTRIGVIDQGIEGRDEYVLLTRLDDDMTPEFAEDWLLPQVFRESIVAGGYYCTSVTTMPRPYRDNEIVAIIHHRYDV